MTRGTAGKAALFASETQVMQAITTMVAPYNARIFLSMGCAALAAAQYTLVAYTCGMLAEAASEANWPRASLLAGQVAVSAAVLVLLNSVANLVAHAVAADVQRDLRRETGARLKTVSLGAFHDMSQEDLRALVVEDIETMEDGIAHLPTELAAAYSGPLVMLVTMLFVDLRLTLVALLPFCLGVMVMARVMRKSGAVTQELNQAQSDMLVRMSEVFRVLPVVKTYNNADAATSRARATIDEFDSVVEAWNATALPPSNLFFVLVGSGLTFLSPVALWLYGKGSVGIDALVFFHAAVLSLSLIVSSLFGLAARLRQQGRVIARRNEFLRMPIMHFPQEQAAQTGTDIRFNAVSFSRNGQKTLDNVSFDLPQGHTLAVVGPSGAGKSTMVRLIARFWDVDDGSICIGGMDIREMSARQLAENVAFVFQDNFLFSRSISDNLHVARPNATKSDLEAAAQAAQAHDLITQLPDGYDTILSPSLRLSGGQKQRLCIARAFLQDAPVLVLDEAMAFVDPESEAMVSTALKALRKGRTTIIVAHRLHTISQADQIVFLENGVITERGTHDALMARNAGYAAQWYRYSEAQDFRLRQTGMELG